jgi:hypothetical protein
MTVMMIVKNLDLSLKEIYRSLKMDSRHILANTESKVINWDRLEALCAGFIKSTTIVMVTIVCCWGVYWLLAQTFGVL